MYSKKQRRPEPFKTSIKRLKNQSFQKGIKVVDNKETKTNKTIQETGAKKRIKQKSLSAIFTKRLKEMPDKGLPAANLNTASTPVISFTKVSEEHVGKTLLAKKRKISEKKSLSDIFSSRSKNQNDISNLIQKHRINESTKPNKSKIIHKEQPASKETEKIDLDRMIGKKHKKKTLDNDRESNRKPELIHKASGKISSLFGNNPDIPTIGQRFVKPINEPIFTEVIFADLDIHPFMVSIYTYLKIRTLT